MEFNGGKVDYLCALMASERLFWLHNPTRQQGLIVVGLKRAL